MTEKDIPPEVIDLFRKSYDQGFADACETMIEGFTELRRNRGISVLTTNQVIEAIRAGIEMQKNVKTPRL